MVVTQANLDHLRRELSDKYDGKWEALSTRLDGKVGFRVFWSVFGLTISVLVTMFGYIANQIHDLQEKTYDIKSEVSAIGGVLNNYELTIEE